LQLERLSESELGRLAESGSTSARRRRPGWLVASIALVAGLPVLSQSVAAGSAAASKTGRITIYAGMDRPWGIATGPGGALWFTNEDSNSIGRITTTRGRRWGLGAGRHQRRRIRASKTRNDLAMILRDEVLFHPAARRGKLTL
jgi:streptogramin lyase